MARPDLDSGDQRLVVARADAARDSHAVPEASVIHEVHVVAVRIWVDPRKNNVVRSRSELVAVVGRYDDDLSIERSPLYRFDTPDTQ